MVSNLSQPETVQLCHENVNRSCIKSPLGLYWLSLETSWWWFQTSVLHFKQLHSLANFLITSLACAGWPWCPSAWSGPWRGAGTLEPDFVCFTIPVKWYFVTLLSSTCPSSSLTVHCCYWPPGLSHQVQGVCVRGMHQHLLDSAPCVQRSCVLHRCQWWWDGGISKCSQLCMGFDKCFVIFYTYHCYDSLWQDSLNS